MNATVGSRVVLKRKYLGRYRNGQVSEVLMGGRHFGIHLAGYYHDHRPITVDFHRKEFTVKAAPLPLHEHN